MTIRWSNVQAIACTVWLPQAPEFPVFDFFYHPLTFWETQKYSWFFFEKFGSNFVKTINFFFLILFDFDVICLSNDLVLMSFNIN